MSTATMKKSEVGELRPSQLLLTFGVGAIVDLPSMSVMVMGLDDWPVRYSTEVGEDRLLLSVQETLGTQVKRLLTPPRLDKALDMIRHCASDPLCAERRPGREGVTLHGAACHACTFVPETSCERGNKYRDRSVLVETVEPAGVAFFE